jgi:flagellar protein FlgJ
MSLISGLPPTDNLNIQLETKKLENLQKKGSSLKTNESKDKELWEAANQFEAIFYQQMLKAMRSTIEKSGLIDGGRAEEIFQDMLDGKYSETMSKKGTLGISEIIYSELKRENKNK